MAAQCLAHLTTKIMIIEIQTIKDILANHTANYHYINNINYEDWCYLVLNPQVIIIYHYYCY